MVKINYSKIEIYLILELKIIFFFYLKKKNKNEKIISFLFKIKRETRRSFIRVFCFLNAGKINKWKIWKTRNKIKTKQKKNRRNFLINKIKYS